MKFKGIIFDFNGVLLWDTEWHEQAWREAAQELLGRSLTQEELDYMPGRTNKDLLTHFFTRDLTEGEVEKYTEVKERIYRDITLGKRGNFGLSPGAEKLLDLIVEREVSHTIATSSERNNLDFFISNLNLARWFDVDTIIFDDGTLLGKPAPDLYVRAAEKLCLPPEECVVIEDAKSGIEAARNAHVGKVIAVGLKNKHAQLRAWGADQTTENLGALSLDDF
ncbi:HAD family phosphatase [Candidatus Kaiserbacteria bacterium]|nr:HAD family phosphatase [Candidatus Kaiserbacteria bacterium]